MKKVVGSGSAPLVNAYTAFKGRGYEILGRRQRNTCRKVPLQVNFLHDDILHGLLRVLSLYARRIVTCSDRFRSSKLWVLHKMFSLSCGNAELLHIFSSQVNVSHDVFDSTIWHCRTHYLYTKIFQPTVSDISSQMHSPCLGDKVDIGKGLSYRPASLCSLGAGRTFLCRSWIYSPLMYYEFSYIDAEPKAQSAASTNISNPVFIFVSP